MGVLLSNELMSRYGSSFKFKYYNVNEECLEICFLNGNCINIHTYYLIKELWQQLIRNC